MIPLARQHSTVPMRTQVTSMPVACDTAPHTPPSTRLSSLRRRDRNLRGDVLVVVVAMAMARPVVAAPVAATGAVALGVRADEGRRLGRRRTFAAVRERDGQRFGRAPALGERERAGILCLCDTSMIARVTEAGPSGTSLRGPGPLQGPTRVFPDSPEAHPKSE